VNRVFFLLNAAFAMAILDLISREQLVAYLYGDGLQDFSMNWTMRWLRGKLGT
jgi:hypothetical protein